MRIAPRQYSDERHLAEIEQRLTAGAVAGDVLFEQACCLEDLGRDESAAQAYLAVLKGDPRHLGALTNLGLMMMSRGNVTAARAFFTQAVTHHALSPLAHVNLAQALREQGEIVSAEAHYMAALTFEREFFAAHQGLALLYESIGDLPRAERHRTQAFAKRWSWTLPYAGSGPPLRVLMLVSARGGDIVTHPFLDDRIVETTMCVPEGFRPGSVLPPHDIVFNSIGDADRCRPALERAIAMISQSSARVVNDPARVLATGRAATAKRLGEIPGIVVARTELLARSAITADGLRCAGWMFPLLVRAPGYQGGRFFERVEVPEDLDAALASLPGSELFVIAFVDTRSADENVRKYRVLFIGGKLYPVHLAIARDWKVHYFSADMMERADHRDEEARFLTEMPSELGSSAVEALASVARVLGLDYAGVDFALDSAGNVNVFEANATMAVYLPPPGDTWAYRRPAYDAVIAAVRRLLAGDLAPVNRS